jgi:hypothetical protein
MGPSPVFLVTLLSAIAFIGVVSLFLLVFALPSLAVLALIHRLTQELFAAARVWRSSCVLLLTLTVQKTNQFALGLLCASLRIVAAERQALFVSWLEKSLKFVR